MALYVNGKVSATYAVLGLGYGGRSCACPSPARNASQREAGAVSRARRDIFTAMEFIGRCVSFGSIWINASVDSHGCLYN